LRRLPLVFYLLVSVLSFVMLLVGAVGLAYGGGGALAPARSEPRVVQATLLPVAVIDLRPSMLYGNATSLATGAGGDMLAAPARLVEGVRATARLSPEAPGAAIEYTIYVDVCGYSMRIGGGRISPGEWVALDFAEARRLAEAAAREAGLTLQPETKLHVDFTAHMIINGSEARLEAGVTASNASNKVAVTATPATEKLTVTPPPPPVAARDRDEGLAGLLPRGRAALAALAAGAAGLLLAAAHYAATAQRGPIPGSLAVEAELPSGIISEAAVLASTDDLVEIARRNSQHVLVDTRKGYACTETVTGKTLCAKLPRQKPREDTRIEDQDAASTA